MTWHLSVSTLRAVPELIRIGKEAVVRHHAEVPFRLLEEVPDLSCPPAEGDTENLNDAVNSPEIHQWLGHAVGKEADDLSRHDKWLCLMYPRLVLLHQFLRDDGAIFVSIDDFEFERLKAEGRMWFGKTGNSRPRIKTYLSESEGVSAWSWWPHEETGNNQEAKKEINEIVGFETPFDTPKPVRLLQRILQIASDKDSLILDSFAGSGTTGHAVLALNKQDGDNCRFILVEIDEKIACDITRERVARVAQGYKNAKGEAVPGLSGGFQFALLGKPLFDETGAIRSDVKFPELSEFVFFKETGRPLPRAVGRVPSRGAPVASKRSSPGQGTGPTTQLLGVHHGRAVYLLFNGILGDRTVNGGNVLTSPVLAQLPAHDGPKVICAAACRLGRPRLESEQVTFKQTPYDLQV